jgi:hypothetical protein
MCSEWRISTLEMRVDSFSGAAETEGLSGGGAMKAVDGKILLVDGEEFAHACALADVDERSISKVDCVIPILAHQLANPGNICPGESFPKWLPALQVDRRDGREPPPGQAKRSSMRRQRARPAALHLSESRSLPLCGQTVRGIACRSFRNDGDCCPLRRPEDP